MDFAEFDTLFRFHDHNDHEPPAADLLEFIAEEAVTGSAERDSIRRDR